MTTTAPAPVARSASTLRPSSSTGTGTTSSPAAARTARWGARLGSSTATASWPAARRTRPSSARAWVTPAQTTMRPGSATTPRVRARWAASALAQRGHPARVGVAERRVRDVVQDGARGPQPLRAREAGEVADAGEEVVGAWPAGRPGGPRGHGGGRLRDDGARPVPRGQEALGDELLVGLDDEPARDAEVARERPRGRQPRADGQPPVPDGRAQPGLELRPQRPRAAVELEQQLRPRPARTVRGGASGPLFDHRGGPYAGATTAA